MKSKEMTGLKALERLNVNCIRTNGIDDEFYKEFRIVQEDLEVLELLKKLILSGEIKVCEDTLLDYPEIAGWLEDE